MESGSSQGCGSPECCLDYGFAFNNVKFSDKTLQIEIIPESHGSEPDPNDSLAVWDRNRKRRCADGLEDSNGHEAVQSNGIPSSIDSYATQMKTIHVSSPILSAKSPFFYKLFSNGMAESNQQHVTLRIQESEESAFMDLLKYMYTNTLLRTTPSALLDVLMVADKFEVASCMRYCGRSLQKLPMTCESALLYLDLPSTIWISLRPIADIVQPLTDAAKEFIVARFKNISKFQEEMLNLHLAGIEAVLLSDELQVDSEDYIYDFVMKWARTHYTNSDERREILTTRLLRLIRFQFMSFRKLEKVLTCTDINLEISSKLVFHALSFKAGTPHRQPSPVSHIGNVMSRLVERAYEYRPVRVMRFDSPREECVVYLDLKREECARLFPSGLVPSEPFHLGGKVFSLIGRCNMKHHSSRHYFGCMFLMQENESAGIMFEVEFSARTKPSEEFVSKYKGNEFGGGRVAGCLNLFGVPWTQFVAEDSPYFINGVLHLRAELKIKK